MSNKNETLKQNTQSGLTPPDSPLIPTREDDATEETIFVEANTKPADPDVHFVIFQEIIEGLSNDPDLSSQPDSNSELASFNPATKLSDNIDSPTEPKKDAA